MCNLRLVKLQQELSFKSYNSLIVRFAVHACSMCSLSLYGAQILLNFVLQCGQLLQFVLSVIQILVTGQQLRSFPNACCNLDVSRMIDNHEM